MKLVNRNYTQPYPQEALEGELGVNSSDISHALGVPVSEVHRKIKRGTWCTKDHWKPMAYTIINENNRLDTYYSFNLRGAKAFVARYVSNKGDGYLDYLFECEEMIENQMPLLIKQLEALQQWHVKKTKKRSFMVRTKAFIQRGLFGEEVEVIKETRAYENLTPTEKDVWRFEHRSKIAEGLNKANNEELKQGKILAVASPKLLSARS